MHHTTGATVIMWNTSKVASNSNGFMDVTLDVSCTPGSISFTTNKGNNPICEKGGIWAWSNTNGDSITVTPVGNTVPVTVPFTLTLNDPSGDYSKRQTQTINITFPAVR